VTLRNEMSSNRGIETKPSTTASIMCLVRAASYRDRRECYSGPDYVAYELVPGYFKLVIGSRWLFKVLSRQWFSKGIYEYVIARTRYFDEAFVAALSQGFDEIVIFGAGFDSRAIRFGDLNKGTTVFELDAPMTQQEKLKAYESKKITVPKGLVYVSIDFNKEKLEDKINQAGFVTGKKTLSMLEGVTMYLSKDAVEGTLRFISESSGEGSMIVFDHIYGGVLRGENKYYGEKGMYERLAKAGEEWTFALEEDEAEPFLGKFGFTVKDCCGAHELEERYFRNSNGDIVAKINGIHAIVTAIKS
jgi:methyltransferase (TIGR00027 family)